LNLSKLLKKKGWARKRRSHEEPWRILRRRPTYRWRLLNPKRNGEDTSIPTFNGSPGKAFLCSIMNLQKMTLRRRNIESWFRTTATSMQRNGVS
jgi:hypothetical protein